MIADGNEAFDERRLRLVVDHSIALRWPMLTTIVVIAAIACTAVPPWVVGAWALLAVCIRESRAAMIRHATTDSGRSLAARLDLVAWSTLALGLAYGVSAFFMLRLDTALGAVLTMILMSVSAGAVSTTFTLPKAFMMHAAAISIPIASMWAAVGGWLGWSVCVLVLMFVSVQRRFARQNMQMFEESYRMRMDNVALLQELTSERGRLAEARDVAVEADLAKSRFLAAASHDLRQPLQSLSLNSGALSRMPLSGESKAIASEIDTGIEALRQMLDALLDVSKLDAGGVRPDFKQLPLDRLLEGLCARFRSTAAARGLSLTMDCPAGTVIMSDAELMQRVVSNLIDNAIKFTAQGGVTLCAQQQEGCVCLTVSDTGCGIDPADHGRVFEDLVQLGNPQRSRAFGHGLGLGIVRRLARLLKIDCQIDSALGQGTRFVLRIPTGEHLPATVAETHAAHPALLTRRILVLDDDPGVRSAYGHALTSLGCSVYPVCTVEEAVLLLPEMEPEVALVDYRLSQDENGLDAIRRMRSLRPSLAAVIVSADSSPDLRLAASSLSVPLLRKPVTDVSLATAINQALGVAP
ncbi:MAG: ATP-binding protein [Vitreoscilla sp.]